MPFNEGIKSFSNGTWDSSYNGEYQTKEVISGKAITDS